MAKAKIVVDSEGCFYGIRISCPGCSPAAHVLPVDWTPDGYERSPDQTKESWGFNGDLERPTFSPSILSKWIWGSPPVTQANLEEWKRAPWEQCQVEHVCHSYITDGRIEFLNDCTHGLAGQTVSLPDIVIREYI